MSKPNTMSNWHIKTVLFDFMGTCLDWHTSIIAALPQSLSEDEKSQLAIEWRHAYFDANTVRLHEGKDPEDIDITHRRVLDELLERFPHLRSQFPPEAKESAVKGWHHQRAWPEVADAIQKIKDQGREVFVHANGTTRLQLDICRSSGLSFDMLFSSELVGYYKPDHRNYRRVLELIKRRPEECVTVAAHNDDLRGAKAVGMRTIYIHRWTDDVSWDQELIKRENDVYLNDMNNLAEVILKLE